MWQVWTEHWTGLTSSHWLDNHSFSVLFLPMSVTPIIYQSIVKHQGTVTLLKDLLFKFNKVISLWRLRGISHLIFIWLHSLLEKLFILMHKFSSVPPLPLSLLRCVSKTKFFLRWYQMETTIHPINYSLWGRRMWHILQNQLKRQRSQSAHYVFSPDAAH